jgi:hypothetical protein
MGEFNLLDEKCPNNIENSVLVSKKKSNAVPGKLHNIATRTGESRRLKTAQNSQCSKAGNAVRVT